MTDNKFVLQRRSADGWRRFLVADEALVKQFGVTGRLVRAMVFPTEQAAEVFRMRHGLSQFVVAVADGDDSEAAMRLFRADKK